ncbi:MAG: anaerobic ribonucleoside-triphosphate reductase, partial [Promethearchaeota archaeon]
LGDFNNAFLNKFSSLKERTYMVDLLTSQFSKYNENFHNIHKHLTLDFNFRSDSAKANSINPETIITLIDSIKSDTINGNGMLWEFGFSNFTQLSKENDYIFEILSSDLRNSIIIYNNNYSSLLNSTLTKINNPQSNELILDKILINLHLISVEANQNDELFLEKLQDKMNSVFELFKFKEQLVKKKLKSNKQWKTLNSIISGKNEVDIFQKAIKSISFFGLNTAITNHCGIELDRTDNSLRFALNIFTLMRKLIEEHNGGGDNRYLLNQPHDGKYLSDSLQNGLSKQNQSLISYSPRFIRESSSLELTKKIDLYRKFENLISGGSVFNQIINQDRVSLKDDLKTIFNSTINAISFKS